MIGCLMILRKMRKKPDNRNINEAAQKVITCCIVRCMDHAWLEECSQCKDLYPLVRVDRNTIMFLRFVVECKVAQSSHNARSR